MQAPLRRRAAGPHRRVPRPARPRRPTRSPTARSASTSSTTSCPRRSRPVREAGKRTLGQRHFDVQIMGGAALHFGWVAEMKTGEGKTLVATLPRVPQRARRPRRAPRHRQRLPRQARRRVDGPDLPLPRARGRDRRPRDRRPGRRRPAYAADITYGTNNEFGFDYLRDNMARRRTEEQVQRGHFFAIVDEVDSILIDEARTPLIISGRADDAAGALLPVRRDREGSPARPRLRGRRGEAHRRARPRRASAASRRRSTSTTSTSTSTRTSCTSSRPRCAPRSCSSATSTTSSQDGEVKIVDEFTGRILEGRRWSEGLHQAVEAKEARADQGGEPDPRDRHAPELLPHVREARGHDRYRGDRGGRVRAHLRRSRSCRSRPTGRWSATTSPTSSTRPRTPSSTPPPTTSPERHETGQPVLVGTISVEKSEQLVATARRAAGSRTRC